MTNNENELIMPTFDEINAIKSGLISPEDVIAKRNKENNFNENSDEL